MADKKISELTELTTPDGTEELVVNDSGVSKKITQTNLLSTALPLAGGTMTGTIAGFTSTGIDDNATSTAITIDASENVLIGQTTSNFSVKGIRLRSDVGQITSTRDGGSPLALNRLTSDGSVLDFNKDGTAFGSIATWDGELAVGRLNAALLFDDDANRIKPHSVASNTVRDNALDFGGPSARFDDIYATNGTIQTSDKNEKQDIEELSTAETAVATACKGLLRKFRWQDAVAEKGDDARIHFGIIAQDLQDAFAAEGLDAGRYAMFISSTWYEKEVEVPAVEAVEAVEATYDDEGAELTPAVEAVEAKDAYTRTDTEDEPTEGYTERTRLGVRYPELLAFIISAI